MRSWILGCALAVTAATLVAMPANAHHDSCPSGHSIVGGTASGTLDAQNVQDNWAHTSSLRRTFTLSETRAGFNVYLVVYNGDCSQVLCQAVDDAAVKSCSTTEPGVVDAKVFWFGDSVVSYTLTVTEAPQECADGADNDGDGRTDYPADLGCASGTDASESPDPQCGDGVDNDGDGWTDYPSDPGCASSRDLTEGPNPQCSDGTDNDGDGWTDYPNDPGCTGGADNAESPNPQCSDGIDNDADGRTDYPNDPSCTSLADSQESCPPVAGPVAICLIPTTELQRVTVHDVVDPGGATHDVAGYVEIYRFTLPTGTIASLPCVRVLVASTGVNPCAAAGGVFVSREATLVDVTVTEPDPGIGDPIATAAICHADVEVTVNSIGVNSTPAFALC